MKRNVVHPKEISELQPGPVVMLDEDTDQTSAGFLLSA